MPEPSALYTAAVLQARRRGLTLTRAAIRDIEQAFRDAARAIEFDLATDTNPVSLARGQALQREVLGILDELERHTARTVSGSVQTTVTDLLAIHQRVTARLLAAEQVVGVVPSLASLDVRTLVVLAARRRAESFQTLVHRNVQEAAPALDRLVNQAVVRGVSIRTLTRDVADLLARAEGANLSRYGIDESDVTGLRTLHYDARRIAASETLNALRESQVQAMQASPLILAVRWGLSGNHPSPPDECDILAAADLYGLGGGLYPPERFPIAPHPFCGCSSTETILRPVSEWATPRGPAPAMAISIEEIDPASLVGGSIWSDLRVSRAHATLRAALLHPIGRERRAA